MFIHTKPRKRAIDGIITPMPKFWQSYPVSSPKQRLVLGVFAIFVVAGAVSATILFRKGPVSESSRPQEKRPASLTEEQKRKLAELSQDDDNDGLKNWEEALWRTDPKNPDSDGDGTPDGKEILAGRDPAKKGPNDRLDQKIAADLRANAPPVKDNLTFKLADSLFQSGVMGEIGPTGQIASRGFLDNLTLPKELKSDASLISAPMITERDLSINPASDLDAIRIYFQAISAIYQKYITPHQSPGDLTILSDALQNQRPEGLAGLDVLIDALTRAIAEIRALRTPSAYSSFAVREVNYLLEARQIIRIFRRANEDPLAAVLVIQKRFVLINEIRNFHIETILDLKTRGIDLVF